MAHPKTWLLSGSFFLLTALSACGGGGGGGAVDTSTGASGQQNAQNGTGASSPTVNQPIGAPSGGGGTGSSGSGSGTGGSTVGCSSPGSSSGSGSGTAGPPTVGATTIVSGSATTSTGSTGAATTGNGTSVSPGLGISSPTDPGSPTPVPIGSPPSGGNSGGSTGSSSCDVVPGGSGSAGSGTVSGTPGGTDVGSGQSGTGTSGPGTIVGPLSCLTTTTIGIVPPAGWTLAWNDEFNAPNGCAVDSSRWNFDLGVGSTDVNNPHLSTYTDRTVNAVQQDGNLVITAAKETFIGADGLSHDYTSASIKTLGLFSQQYGRFEARINAPFILGVQPVFSLIGVDQPNTSWPSSGEIDIMENIGIPYQTYTALQGPGYSTPGLTQQYLMPGNSAPGQAFHVYALEWAPNSIKFYFDGTLISSRTPADLPVGTTWVFNHPFYIQLGMTVGGKWSGNPTTVATWPQHMLVDWVRAYTAAQ